jgi:hypothetical protein
MLVRRMVAARADDGRRVMGAAPSALRFSRLSGRSASHLSPNGREIAMHRILVVLDDIDRECDGEHVALRAGRYDAVPVGVGFASPGQDVGQLPAHSYVLNAKPPRRDGGSITAASLEQLRQEGLLDFED